MAVNSPPSRRIAVSMSSSPDRTERDDRLEPLVRENERLRQRIAELENRSAPGIRRAALLEEAQRIARFGYFGIRDGGRVLEWSPELRELIDVAPTVEPSEALLLDRIHPDDRARFRRAYRRGIAEGRMLFERARVITTRGEIRHVGIGGHVVRDEFGGSIEFCGVLQDLTDQVALEQRLIDAQRLEALAQLAGGIAHDFNNLLMVIRGNIELLRGQTGSVPITEIEQATFEATSLTRQLQAFGRGAALSRRWLQLDEVVADAIVTIERLLGHRFDLTYRLEAPSCRVLADATALEQVLIELALHARARMPDGGSLSIHTKVVSASDLPMPVGARSEPEAWALLSLTDTAPIDPRLSNRIFEPSFASGTSDDATSLGLATVFGAVSQHGGIIDVQVQPGRGTTFHVALPSSQQPTPHATVEERSATGSEARATVVLVEDEDAVRSVITRLLELAGYDVVAFSRPDSALDRWPELTGRVALLLTDVMMPGMPGTELAYRVRSTAPALPILFITGHRGDELDDDLSRTRWLAKPFGRDALLTAIEALIDTR